MQQESHIVATLLNYFDEERFLTSRGVTKSIAWGDAVPKTKVSECLRALNLTGLLEKNGGKYDASYLLTDLGVLVRDRLGLKIRT